MRVCRRCRSLYRANARFCAIDGQPLEGTSDDPLLGAQLGRYRIVSLLGRGTTGSVYRATHSELGSDFALKVLYGQYAVQGGYIERFRREAQAVGKIRSPWVAAMLDFVQDDGGLVYLVMEYCSGTTLDRLIARDRHFSQVRAARLVAQVASGLAVAHRLGFVHRDVKPANLVVDLVNGVERSKVLDFGIVQLSSTDAFGKLTFEGMIMGTPAYMSPEQAGSREVTAKSDLYSLGVVLYQLLAGRKPFSGGPAEQMEAHLSKNPEPLPISGPLADLAYALMEKDPERRPPSAQWVAETAKRIEVDLRGGEASLDPGDIDQLANVRVAQLRSEQDPTVIDAHNTQQLRRRRPRLGWVLGAFTAAVLAGAFGTWALRGPPRQEAAPIARSARVAALAIELDQVLEARGLTRADLATTPRSQELLHQASLLRTGDPALEPLLVALLKEARHLPLTAEALTARLDALDARLAETESKLAPEDFERLKANYVELYRQAKHAEDEAELAALGRAIRDFERSFGGDPLSAKQ